MNTTAQNVIAEHIGNDAWMVMWPDGKVREFASRKDAEKAIRRSIKVKADEMKVTRIEWRG